MTESPISFNVDNSTGHLLVTVTKSLNEKILVAINNDTGRLEVTVREHNE